jgi:16S rRNA (uracil1498-N3)-methyltransferase
MTREEEQEGSDLAEPSGRLRLFVRAPLGTGREIRPDDEQAHYLLRVMRAADGDRVLLFNGADGEWNARIAKSGKRGVALLCETQAAAQSDVPDLWLAFAPIKKVPADYLTQKATELGVRVLQPVITHRTIARRVNTSRMAANAVEAAEQSGRLSVPEVREPVALEALLERWPRDRSLIFCDEGGEAMPIADALRESRQQAYGVLTGPEGGFDEAERRLIRSQAFVLPVTLGPRIMRADTAALAALAVWQSLSGDWRRPRT